MRSLDEYRNTRPQPQKTAGPELRMLAQEAVRLEALTGDEAWDHFLSYLESALKTAERMHAAEDAKLRNPFLVNDDAIRMAKAHVACLQVRIDTLKEILLLPKFLKDRAALAKAQIADLAKGA